MTHRERFGVVVTLAAFSLAGCSSAITHPSTLGATSPSPTSTPTAPISTPSHPVGLAFWDAQRGLLIATPPCTSSGSTCPGGLIERTDDGGKTWHLVDRVSASLMAVAVAGRDVAWVSEQSGANCGSGPNACMAPALLLTTNGGAIWRAVSSRTPVVSVSPVSATTAWAVAGFPSAYNTGTALVRSGDGGQTWQQRGDPCSRFGGVGPWAVIFAGPVHGWLICIGVPATDMQPKALFATHDGGATWQLESDTCASSASGHVIASVGLLSCVGYLPVMSFLPDGHGWMYASRGSLSATSNAGRTWAQIGTNIVNNDVNDVISLSLVADVTGLVLVGHSEFYPACPAVGCGPELLSTHDAGRTWTTLSSWTS